jgi:hypothetical protein
LPKEIPVTGNISTFLENQKAKILADANDAVAVVASDLAQLEALAAKYGFQLIPPGCEFSDPHLQNLHDEGETHVRTLPPLFPPRRVFAPLTESEPGDPIEVAS